MQSKSSLTVILIESRIIGRSSIKVEVSGLIARESFDLIIFKGGISHHFDVLRSSKFFNSCIRDD